MFQATNMHQNRKLYTKAAWDACDIKMYGDKHRMFIMQQNITIVAVPYWNDENSIFM